MNLKFELSVFFLLIPEKMTDFCLKWLNTLVLDWIINMIGEIFDFLSNLLLLGLRGFLNISNQLLQLLLIIIIIIYSSSDWKRSHGNWDLLSGLICCNFITALYKLLLVSFCHLNAFEILRRTIPNISTDLFHK